MESFMKVDFIKYSILCLFSLINTGWARLIQSHSSARICFKLSGTSN